MNNYITGTTIKTLRDKLHLTQSQLAEKLCVSDKAISKWETGKGFPDISLIEPLATALRVSIPELLTGEQIINTNRSANIMKSNIYIFARYAETFYSPQVRLLFPVAGLHYRQRKQKTQMMHISFYAKKLMMNTAYLLIIL